MQRFVEFGYANACKAIDGELLAVVRAEYAERLAKASWWRRIWIGRQIAREARRRMDRVAPPDALY